MVYITLGKQEEIVKFVQQMLETNESKDTVSSNMIFGVEFGKYLQSANFSNQKIENIIWRIKGAICVECTGDDNCNVEIYPFFIVDETDWQFNASVVTKHFKTNHPSIFQAIWYINIFIAYSQQTIL